MASAEQAIEVEVVFALPQRQELVSVRLVEGATAGEALRRSGLASRFDEIDADNALLAVWGEPVEAGHRLRHGDRVEVLRPLEIDPREARRLLASEGRTMAEKDGESG